MSELSSSISVLRRELQRAQEQRNAMKNLFTQKQKSTPSSGISTPRKRSEQSTPQDGSPGSASNPKKTGTMETSPGVCVQRFSCFFFPRSTPQSVHTSKMSHKEHTIFTLVLRNSLSKSRSTSFTVGGWERGVPAEASGRNRHCCGRYLFMSISNGNVLVHTYTCIHAYVSVCMHLSVCMYACGSLSMYIHTYVVCLHNVWIRQCIFSEKYFYQHGFSVSTARKLCLQALLVFRQ